MSEFEKKYLNLAKLQTLEDILANKQDVLNAQPTHNYGHHWWYDTISNPNLPLTGLVASLAKEDRSIANSELQRVCFICEGFGHSMGELYGSKAFFDLSDEKAKGYHEKAHKAYYIDKDMTEYKRLQKELLVN
jgi:hypothetical protein